MKIHARASWESGLTDLKVRAAVRSSSGDSAVTVLSDGGALSETAGEYSAEIANLEVGHYKGLISIESKAKNVRADTLHRLAHSTDLSLSSRSQAPKFRRVIPFYFQVVKGS